MVCDPDLSPTRARVLLLAAMITPHDRVDQLSISVGASLIRANQMNVIILKTVPLRATVTWNVARLR
jgi:hypothetical protein